MKRREFLAASCLAAASLSDMSTASSKTSASKQFLELRHYEIDSAEHQEVLDGFLAKVAIPALNRLDIGPIGVFIMTENENHDLWVLVPHNSLESVATVNTKMLADTQCQKDGSVVLNCPMDNPVYKSFKSSLLLAFDKCPKVEVPTKKENRVFQLRIYESHNTVMAKRKIEMFNEGGEIALFRNSGMNPVFFGEDSEAQEAGWKKFLNDPEWEKLSSKPYFEDTVSNITNLVLRPASSSQI
ncbi:MAG: NIPSNAP family protein [Planctomycetota bacterium]|jgi:hypothetical protein